MKLLEKRFTSQVYHRSKNKLDDDDLLNAVCDKVYSYGACENEDRALFEKLFSNLKSSKGNSISNDYPVIIFDINKELN